MRLSRRLLPIIAVLALAAAPAASAATKSPKSSSPTATASSGGAGLGAPATPVSTIAHPMIQGDTAKIINGVAYAPSFAPPAVQRAIWAGNQIRHKPYIYGGGHGTWNDAGYDCSGSVSYVLHAAGLLKQSMDSGEFMSWDESGLGQWITIYTNPGHAFIEIAGIRFDTSAEGDPNPPPGTGPRWRPLLTDSQGFVKRHPIGL